MSVINISRITPAPLHPHRLCDNGQVVTWRAEAGIAAALNHAARWHTREAFRYVGQVASIAAKAGAGQRKRWRCAWHTGPMTTRMWVAFGCGQAQVTGDPYAKFEIDGGGDSATFHFGGGGGALANAPSTLGYAVRSIEVSPNTQYTGLWSDYDDARLFSGCLFEESYEPDTDNGYAEPNAAVTGPIFDARRAATLGLADDLWSRGAHTFSWVVDTDAAVRTRTSATDINLIDNTSTAVSAATPGYKIDLRYRRRRRATTVPVRIRVCALVAGGGTAHVYLKDSGGSTVATVTITGASEAWFTTDVNLPATDAKYDIHYDSDGANQVSVFAVSAYEHVP